MQDKAIIVKLSFHGSSEASGRLWCPGSFERKSIAFMESNNEAIPFFFPVQSAEHM